MVNRRLVTVLAAAISAVGAVPAPALAVRAMTWNIAGSPFNTRGTVGLPFAMGDIEAVVARNGPDVLALQEACSWQSAALARDLGLAVWHETAVARFTDTRPGSPGTCDYGDALLGRVDPAQRVRVDLLDPGRCKSDATVPAQSPLPECRLLIGADFAGLRAATMHVGIDPTQSVQLDRIVAAAAATPGPALLMGDMNVLPQDPRLAPRLAVRGFREVTGTVPGLPCSAAPRCRQTFPSGGLFGQPVSRPDMVFTRGLRTGARHGPADVMVGGRPASDHRPLVADLEPAPADGAVAIRPRRLRTVARRGPAVAVGMLLAGHVQARLLASPATVRALGLRARTLAEADMTTSGAGTLRISLPPKPWATRALAAAGRVTLTVDVRVNGTLLPATTFIVRP